MPPQFIPNIGSQIDRALKAYFLANQANPQPIVAPDWDGGIFLTLDNKDRSNPCRTIFAHDAQESVRFSGNQEFTVEIIDQFEALVQPNQANAGFNRVAIDNQVGIMMALMMISSNGDDLDQTVSNITNAGRALATFGAGGLSYSAKQAQNNADMAQFTCLFVEPFGQKRGHPTNDDGIANRTHWVEQRTFKITAAPSFIPGYPVDPTDFPIAIDDGAIVPLMASNGAILALPFYDRVTDQLVYLSIKDWDVDISDSPN